MLTCFLIYLEAIGIPGDVCWQEKTESCGNLTISLAGKRIIIKDSSKKTIWESPGDYYVQDFLISDLDGEIARDGKPRKELILLLWKRGKFGEHKPFWIEKDEKNYSQHIFIYGLNESQKPKAKWFASEVGERISRMKLMEKDPKIILTETEDGENFLWRWESFGLKNIDNEVKFIAFGDNILHEEIIEYAVAKKKGSFDFLYEPFLEEIKSADIASIQVESVLVNDDKKVSGYPFFGAPEAVGQSIAAAGFDIAVCASNHVLDKGPEAVDFTAAFFEKKGIMTTGIQKRSSKEDVPYKIIARNGIRFAIFSYTYGTNASYKSGENPNLVKYLSQTPEEEEAFMKNVENSKNEADFAVIFVHWGEEYQAAVSEQQRYYAQLFADAGADIVIGTHPHVVQKTEEMDRPDGGKTLIFYSLGNFRAYQGQNDGTKEGAEAVIRLEHCFDGVRIKSFETREIDAFVPVRY